MSGEPAALVGAHAPDWEQRSRLSKTNRADNQNGRSRRSIPESRKRPLTDCDGISLRKEVLDHDHLNRDHVDRPISWNGAITQFRDYIRDKEDVQSVFENTVGDCIQGNKPHRFHPEYSSKQYAKLKDLERGISEAYGKRLYTAMLTFTASSTDDSGNPLPPVDHLDGLLESWDAIRRSLDRVFDENRYERVAILEPHKSGYIHIHMAVFVDGIVTSTQFEPVIESHVNNCDLAGWTAHDLDEDDTISVRHAGADRQPGYNHALAEGIEHDSDQLAEIAIYLAEYLGVFDADPLDTPEHIQAANSVLWATNRQRWRPSNGAQQYMATNPRDPDSDWQLVGIETNDEFIP